MKIHLLTGASALALSACAYDPNSLPDVTAQHAVMNTAVSSPLNYRNPLAGFTKRTPTDPRDWRTVNEEQTEGH
jgi:hypothetical protein